MSWRLVQPQALRGPRDADRGPAGGRGCGGSSWRGCDLRLQLQFSLGNSELFTNWSLDSDHNANVFSFCHYRPRSTGRGRCDHWDCQHSTEPRVLVLQLCRPQCDAGHRHQQTLGKLMAREKYGWRLHSEPRHSMISDHNSYRAPMTPRNVRPGESGSWKQPGTD